MLRFSAVLAVVGLLALAANASAAPPDREPLPSGAFTATACGFDVLVEPVKEQFTLMTFPEGRPVVAVRHRALPNSGEQRQRFDHAEYLRAFIHDGESRRFDPVQRGRTLVVLRSSVHKSASACIRDRPNLVRNRRADGRCHRTNRGPLRLARIGRPTSRASLALRCPVAVRVLGVPALTGAPARAPAKGARGSRLPRGLVGSSFHSPARSRSDHLTIALDDSRMWSRMPQPWGEG